MRSGDLHNCTQYDISLKGKARLRTLVRLLGFRARSPVTGPRAEAHGQCCAKRPFLPVP